MLHKNKANRPKQETQGKAVSAARLSTYVDNNDTAQEAKTPPSASLQQALHEAAYTYHKAGLRVIWWRDDPNPAKQWPRWKRWQDAPQTSGEFTELFQRGPYDRIAVLCTDGMEAIDIDVKNDPLANADAEFLTLCAAHETAKNALAKCVQVRTKSGGLHIVYRAPNAQANQKLAHRAGGTQAVIETRGVGGLLFVAPSAGYTIGSGDYCHLPTLSATERDALISVARSMDEPTKEAPVPTDNDVPASGQTPWAAYNERHTVAELAAQYGWRTVGQSGDKLYLNRPHAQHPNGVDAAILTTRAGHQRFYVHTTSTAYTPNQCYDPFGMYAVEAHGGNVQEAAKALRAQGYGDAPTRPKAPTRTATDFEGCKNLQIKGSRYYWETWKEVNGDWKSVTVDISNFVIEPLYHLQHPEHPKRVFGIRNVYGDYQELCAPVKDLANNESFKALVEGKGRFVAYWTARQFAAIKEHWYYHELPAVEVTTLGRIPDTALYAWANGIFDGHAFRPTNERGMVDIAGNRYFIPVLTATSGENVHDKTFVHQPESRMPFAEWARLFCDTFSENDNGRIGVVFACAALFRGLIQGHTNFFPLLFLFGMKGTGKSSFRDALLSLFGQPQTPISLGSASSAKGFNRRLAQRSDALQAFEEYKNGIAPNLIEMLKSVYDGIGYERAQTSNDNRTHHTPVLSAVVVAGQELPTKENALFSRTITTEFLTSQFTDAQKSAYNALQAYQHGAGVTHATLEILSQWHHMEAEFLPTYREMCAYLKGLKAHPDAVANAAQFPHNVDERSINNTAVLVATYTVLEKQLAFPFSLAELLDALTAKLKTQIDLMNDTTEVNQFWKVFEFLVNQRRLVEHRDYKRDSSKGVEWLYLNKGAVYLPYAEQQTRSKGIVLDEATLERYLQRDPAFVRVNGEPTQPTHLSLLKANKRCMVFDLEKLGLCL